jgi:hypothetical protein
MSLNTQIGYQNIKIRNDETLELCLNEIVGIDALQHSIAGNRSDRVNRFDFVLQATLACASDDPLDTVVASRGIRFAKSEENNEIRIFSRFDNHIATIRVSDSILTIILHFRNNFKCREMGVYSLSDLGENDVWNRCVNAMIKFLDKVIPNYQQEINIDRIKNLTEFYRALACEFLKDNGNKDRIEKMIELKYRQGVIRGGCITRLRRLIRSTLDTKQTSNLQEIRDNLSTLLPIASESAKAKNSTEPQVTLFA